MSLPYPFFLNRSHSDFGEKMTGAKEECCGLKSALQGCLIFGQGLKTAISFAVATSQART